MSYAKVHDFLAEQLKKARTEAGLSQKEAAELMSKTQSTISKIEAGLVRIDIGQLKELARIYKRPLDYFIEK
jgi:transcriptional regulator with XRE-family HTH domain